MAERRKGRESKESSRLVKRVISVGFKEPKTLKGSTIYVNLQRYDNGIGAKAVSAADFRYQDPRSLFFAASKTLSNIYYAEGRDIPPIFHPPYDEFIRILAIENRATVKCDGVEIEGEGKGVELGNFLLELQKIIPRHRK